MIEQIPIARKKFNALDDYNKGRAFATCAGYALNHPDGRLFTLLYNALTGEEQGLVDDRLNELLVESMNRKGGKQ